MAQQISPRPLNITIKRALYPTEESSDREKNNSRPAEVVVFDEDGLPDAKSASGAINTFGHMLPSDISWIWLLWSFLLLAVGVTSGLLYDAGFLRNLLVLMSQVMPAQALCVLIGTEWPFIRLNPLEMGIVTYGSGFYDAIYTLIFTSLATTMMPLLVVCRRNSAPKEASLLACIYLIVIHHAASTLDRLTPSLIANHINLIHTIHACFLCITLASLTAGNSTLAIFYGFFTGRAVALREVMLTSSTTDLTCLGTRLGMSSMASDGASLVWAPSYVKTQLFSVSLFIGTAILVGMLRTFYFHGKETTR
ncbi:monocarboxylate permease-like protein, mch4 [Daldinia bambusicola]|nr:monocarboxylate permease-like protein, mch4 [Daldinia bambusicola]